MSNELQTNCTVPDISEIRKPEKIIDTVEPRFNGPLFNEVLDITNDILCPGQSYSKMYEIEPRYNEFMDITNHDNPEAQT